MEIWNRDFLVSASGNIPEAQDRLLKASQIIRSTLAYAARSRPHRNAATPYRRKQYGIDASLLGSPQIGLRCFVSRLMTSTTIDLVDFVDHKPLRKSHDSLYGHRKAWCEDMSDFPPTRCRDTSSESGWLALAILIRATSPSGFETLLRIPIWAYIDWTTRSNQTWHLRSLESSRIRPCAKYGNSMLSAMLSACAASLLRRLAGIVRLGRNLNC
jgi:hypothetical protein